MTKKTRKHIVNLANGHIYLVSALVFLVKHIFFRVKYHELWKDEWQSWFVARDMGWMDMFRFLYYEGHPALWYSYLKLFTPLTPIVSDEWLIKISHAVLFILFTLLLGLFKKVPVWIRIMFLLGYFPFFEYGLVSRGYVLVLLLTFGVLYLILMDNKKANWLLAITLLLVCQTEVYGVLAGGALFLFYVLHKMQPKSLDWRSLVSDKSIIMPGLGLLAGVLLFYWTINWAADATEVRERLGEIMSAYSGKSGWEHAFQGVFGHAFIPGMVSGPTRGSISAEGLWLSLLGLGVSMFILVRHWRLAISFYLFAGITLYFAATTYSGGMRQWGMVYIFFMVCVFAIFQLHIQLDRYRQTALFVLLSIHLWYSFTAFRDEYRFPFTNAKAAGLFLAAEVPDHIPIVGISPFNVAAASGYAGRKFYQLPDGETFTYFRWLEKVYFPPQEELFLFASYKKAPGLAIVTHQKLDTKRYPDLELWRAFDRFNLKDENFYIYRVRL